MIRLANGSTGRTWRSPNFTWPLNTGTNSDSVYLNHNLGTKHYSVDLFNTETTATIYYLQSPDLSTDVGNNSIGYYAFCEENVLWLALYRNSNNNSGTWYAFLRTYE